MPRGKTQKSLDLIAACYEILEEIQPATVRAVCYRLFVMGLIPSMAKTCTNRVSTQLVYARDVGIIPWAWIVDETREAERPGTWEDPERFIAAVMHSYRRDRWAYQADRVEIWSEKGTVRGTLAPLLSAYGITFRVMHGFASATAVHEIARDTTMTGLVHVYYIGDWDPSGLCMSEDDLPKRLDAQQAHVVLTRLALSLEEIGDSLPSFALETKQKDSRHAWFARHYGARCWELDAMNPTDLRAKVEAAIQQHIDWPAWARCAVAEDAERGSLQHVLGNWRTAISGQATI